MNLPLCSRASALLLILRTFVCGLGAAALIPAVPLRAQDYRDDLGYAALKAELGVALPTGNAVSVSQIEVPFDQAHTIYLPDIAGYAAEGKTITVKSGDGSTSGHANSVGSYFYGLYSSMAPGVTMIDAYEVNKWLGSNFLNYGVKDNFGRTVAPLTESRNVQNHSWIGTFDNGGTIDVEILRRFDYAIQTNDFVAVVGLNNGFGNPVPELLASAYNAISVGLSNGGASSGLTTVEGSGRVKPEIVSNANATSFSTPTVGAAVALLRQTAPTVGQHSVTLKAMLLAGATKDQFPNWNRTASRPIDARYGAGQLNVFHSYHIIASGQQAASDTVSVGGRGWDYNMTAASARLYFFDIPAGHTASRLSAILTWNRIIADTISGPGWGNLSSTVPDLALRIYQATGFTKGALVDESVSAVDNIEHLYEATLPPGRYALEVTGNQTGVAYGLAWNTVSSVTIAATTPNASERGLVPGTFTVTRSGPLAGALAVSYTVSGNAAAGTDYASLAGSVTIPANQASATITVMPVADSLAEGDETVTVTLASGLASTFANANATVTLHDQPIDAWRFSHFNAAELGNPAISGDLADGDRDGIPNVVEYALNLDPKAVDVNALPTAYVNAGGFPTLTYTAAASATDINYIVEISTDLVTWNSGPAYIATAQFVEGGASTTVTVSSPNTVTAQPRQFMRLRVTRR